MPNRFSKRPDLDYSVVLEAIFSLMLRDGIRPQVLLALCNRALRQAETGIRGGMMKEPGVPLTAGLVLDAWHRDRRYLTANAVPKAVRLFGPGPSVEALVRRQRRGADAAQIAGRLKALRLIVSCGRGLYKPTSDVAVLSVRDPLVLQHLAKGLSTLLQTVGQNTDGNRRVAPLIERVAEVPDLPRRHVVAFQKFTQIQGRTFLRTVNDWLESRRARRLPRRGTTGTVRAGIHTYAYIASQHAAGSPTQLVRH